MTKTHTEYLSELKSAGIKIKPLDIYTGALTSINHKCTCGQVWNTTPNRVLRGAKCKTCASDSMRLKNFKHLISSTLKTKKIKMLGDYTHSRIPILFKCLVCKNEWSTRPKRIMFCGCPYCKMRNAKSAFLSTNKKVKVGKREVAVQGYEPQAIKILLNYVKPGQLKFGVEVPIIKSLDGRNHYPDIWIPHINTIVEVKSLFTLGITDAFRFKSVQDKAIAAEACGYNYVVMVISTKGELINILLNNWKKWSWTRLLKAVEGKDKNLGARDIGKHLRLI